LDDRNSCVVIKNSCPEPVAGKRKHTEEQGKKEKKGREKESKQGEQTNIINAYPTRALNL